MSRETESDFTSGYDAGRTMCLTVGHEAAATHATLHAADHSEAYGQGWSWALWDYEDANGLPHSSTGA